MNPYIPVLIVCAVTFLLIGMVVGYRMGYNRASKYYSDFYWRTLYDGEAGRLRRKLKGNER